MMNIMGLNLKNYLLVGSIMITISIFIAYPSRVKIKRKAIAFIKYYGYSHRGTEVTGNCPKCQIIFTDNIATHETALENEGITPQKNFRDIEKLSQMGNLVKIKTNESYIVRNAKFSRPYILPKANTFLLELSKKYADECSSEKIGYVPFTISSVTRSIESVEILIGRNGNAIKNSAHLKGKTFDISYRAFNKNKKQNKAFINVLKDLRANKKCFVKFERNGCLHITVI